MLVKLRSHSTMPKSVTITVGAIRKHVLYPSRSAPPGRALRAAEMPITTACRIGPHTQLNTGQPCTSTRPAKYATTRREKDCGGWHSLEVAAHVLGLEAFED